MAIQRTFSADSGSRSTGNAGADYIEKDLDAIITLLNTGLAAENVADGAVTDAKIGTRTIVDTTALADTGTITALLGALARAIKDIKGTLNWKDLPTVSLAFLNAQKSDIGHDHGLNPDGHTHNEFIALDMFGVARVSLTNCTPIRNADGRLTRIDYTVNSGETGSVEFHRNATGRINSVRYSNSLGTQIQVDYVRNTSGRITDFQRSVWNDLIADGDSWV